ncbi:MAG: RDD family protein [Burkholderiales bacterium]|nr:RDD family protein [Burkholderiales bacterium]
MTGHAKTPGIGRRLLSLVYEILLLIAVALLAGGMAAALAQITNPAYTRLFTRVIAITACTAYFAWQWHYRGQTLPMKTWRMRLETVDGMRVAVPRALLRALLATAGYLLLGISVIWALIDRDRQFLHDRLAGTRLVSCA